MDRSGPVEGGSAPPVPAVCPSATRLPPCAPSRSVRGCPRGRTNATRSSWSSRGIASAVAPAEGLTDVQAQLLEAIASALTGFDVDYHGLDPLGPDELAGVLEAKDLGYRQRIVHHMVLGELVLKPLPTEVAHRVASYAKALGVDDHFVRVARRYAQGANGLAWMDLRRSGFVEHVKEVDPALLHTGIRVHRPVPVVGRRPRRRSALDRVPRTSRRARSAGV